MKIGHNCKCCSPSIGCVVIGMNEEKFIHRTLEAILLQTLKPKQVFFVNDNSTDHTLEIAASFDKVTVLNFPEQHENWVIKKELARVFNYGLIELSNELDYGTVVGSDNVLPQNYFEYITKKMNENGLVIASGGIKGEHATIPRGSGRLVDWGWWLQISGGLYPVNYGYESWLIGKCRATGNKFGMFSEIESYVQRPTGSNYKSKLYAHRGQAYRALGYNKRFVLIRAALMIIKYKPPYAALKMLLGFMDRSVENYDDEVRNYYRNLQNEQTSIFKIRGLIERYREL